MGSRSLEVGISHSLKSDSRFIQGTRPLPSLQSQFHLGQGLGGGSLLVVRQGSNRAGSSPGFYSRLFMVMKASGAWRPIIDLSLLNLRVQKTSFKMETLQSVLLSVQAGDWMVSLDLKDAYLQVPMHPESRKFLRFVACGKVYQFKSSLLWPVHGSSGFHTGHGSCFSISSQDRHSVTSVSRRLADASLLPEAGPPCSEDSSSALQFVRDSRQLGEVASASNSAYDVSGSSLELHLFQGFSCPEESREASLNWRHILACVILAGAPWGSVLNDSARSRREATHR